MSCERPSNSNKEFLLSICSAATSSDRQDNKLLSLATRHKSYTATSHFLCPSRSVRVPPDVNQAPGLRNPLAASQAKPPPSFSFSSDIPEPVDPQICQATCAIMKLSFEEEFRRAMNELGG